MATKKKEKLVRLEILSTKIAEEAEQVVFETGIKGFPFGIKAIEGGYHKVRTDLIPLSEAEEIKDKLEKECYDVMILL